MYNIWAPGLQTSVHACTAKAACDWRRERERRKNVKYNGESQVNRAYNVVLCLIACVCVYVREREEKKNITL